MRLLLDMAFVETGCRGGRLGAAGAARPLCRNIKPGEYLLDPPVDKAPGAHVLRLLLAPHDLGVAVALQHPCQRPEWEWIKLLDPRQRDAIFAAFGAGLRQVEIHLARGQDDATHSVVRCDCLGFTDDAVEGGSRRHLIEARADVAS